MNEQKIVSKLLSLVLLVLCAFAISAGITGALRFLWIFIIFFGVLLALFMGFWVGVVFGAPAWRDWAIERKRAREAGDGDR